METIHRDYSPKGVQFFYLYKALAHPELNGYVDPVTLEERLMHIKEAKRTLGTEITWIADSMSNDLKHAIGNRPNSEYLLDPEGKILRMRMWSDPEQLRRDLAEYVGPVENPTQASDLGMETAPAPEHAPTGVVPRIERKGFFRTLTVEPQIEKTDEPFYVKLRAEADRALLREGKGKLYLAFLLDPLYGVHWNNLAPPVDVQLFPPEGVTLSDNKLTGPKVEAKADADPREFLLDVELDEPREPARMSFRYYACTDKWCRPVTQEYLISWAPDPDAGRPRRPGGGRGPGGFIDRIFEMDLDGDEKLSKAEVPERMQRRFDQIDADGDGLLDREEIGSIRSRFGPGRGGPGGRRGGPGRALGRLMENDANGDGKLSRDELPERMQERFFERMDADGDGFITREELAAMRQRFGGGRGR